MNIEDSIFKKYSVDIAKLKAYGFVFEDDDYRYSQNIYNDTFRVDVEINNRGRVSGKVIELSFGEEYSNFRIAGVTGGFSSKIREEFERILKDIRKHCFDKKPFVSDQANRIAKVIFEQYHDLPVFAWEKFPGYGVFKNRNNEKWYALIMNVNKSKIDHGDEEVEIIDVKLSKEKVEKLLLKNGYFKAYHMNKHHWISIILDDTVSDEEIFDCIAESHFYTENVNEWIVPANIQYYDMIHCFDHRDSILWKQSNHIKSGDIVYLYVSRPYSALLYKCGVLESDIPYEYKDKHISMTKVMKLQLLKRLDWENYTLDKLGKYGIKVIRGLRRLPEELKIEINKENNQFKKA